MSSFGEPAPALAQGSFDEAGFDEQGHAGLVGQRIERAGDPRPPTHESGVARPQEVEEVVGARRRSAHLLRVGDDGVGPKDVVAVGRSVGDQSAVEDDGLGLVDGEGGAFDVVGEIRLPERLHRERGRVDGEAMA